ncbi:type VI secretion system protein ImpM [Pseudoduganella lurida]|uniref:Type VI secretion system protein ImpM n=1 Tax=Pseudoduganella lurida TaxID=1036180 RepID=A0A562RBN6_9BURK|nr:type VI secretion system-associated protein TagF [Pseudoduganella lurida]TWI66438.1 type VI secretion system protein ImpM [Pseudoduganella lurida]
MKTPFRIGYFGKLPARSDFVKGGAQHELTGLLDDWLAATMQQLAANPRWKQHYDAAEPLHFAFVGPRSRLAVAGHLAASNDQSGRRFPFIAVGTLEVPRPEDFVAISPLALAPLWQRLGSLADDALTSTEPAAPLQVLGAAVLEGDAECDGDSDGHGTALRRFAEQTDLAALEALLAHAGQAYSARGILLGIGLLLQPFEWSGSTRLDKGLALPLPRAGAAQAAVAAFWLALIMPFLRRVEIELALFVAEIRGQATLVVGFSGATPGTLHAILDPEAAGDRLIAFDETRWVDDMIEHDPAVLRLSACLAQRDLSLAAARQLFRETFT